MCVCDRVCVFYSGAGLPTDLSSEAPNLHRIHTLRRIWPAALLPSAELNTLDQRSKSRDHLSTGQPGGNYVASTALHIAAMRHSTPSSQEPPSAIGFR